MTTATNNKHRERERERETHTRGAPHRQANGTDLGLGLFGLVPLVDPGDELLLVEADGGAGVRLLVAGLDELAPGERIQADEGLLACGRGGKNGRQKRDEKKLNSMIHSPTPEPGNGQ